MRSRVTDEYGNSIGSVEKKNDKYIVRDNYGFREGTIEKDFLSNDYSIYDNYSNKTGRIERDFIGNGATIRNSKGSKIGRVTVVPLGGIGAGGLVAFLVVVVMVFISFDNFTEQLSNAFMIGKPEFITITVSNVILIIINILSMCLKKITIIPYREGFLATLMSELSTGVVIYIALWVIMAIYGIATGEGVLNMLVAAPLAMLMYSLSFLVVMVSVALLFSIILFSIKKTTE